MTLQCNTCKTEKSNLCSLDHLLESKKFCKCFRGYKSSFEELKDEILNSKKRNPCWNIDNLSENYTYKRSYRIPVTCRFCGFKPDKGMLYGNLVRGKGCRGCANMNTTPRLSKDTSWFVERGLRIHKGKYDYSQVVYKKAREKVTILCHDHEDPFMFMQSPDNHLNKGKGCPECKRARLRGVSFFLRRAEENKEYYKSLPSGVYLLDLEEDFKIGITCDTNRRYPEIRRDSGKIVKELLYKEFNLYDALILEDKLHRKYSDANIIYKDVWAGHSECFKLSFQQILDIKREIAEYEEVCTS